MPLTVGARVGSYEIVGVLGAGGMGEVYRARDPKLNREVALKILPDLLAGDPDRLARFRREAQVLASLNHPGIGHIYGFEDSGAIPALILELVEGPTLADRIAQGPIPPNEAIPIARAIAEAIESAHEQGVVHRDLKPSNVKVTLDGTVKVLDFGLAKALDASPAVALAGAGLNVSPTMTSPVMTQQGVICGTAAYMSPEQAKGKPVDRRADIWAFGVVLWEMLTGRTLFARDSISETLAALLKDEPPLDQLPADTPPGLRRLIGRCLERDPRQRLRDIGEARIVLASPFEPADAVRRAVPRRQAAWPYVVAAVALSVLSATAVWLLTPAGQVPLRRLDLPAAIASSRDFALAPDGTRVAYFSGGHLYVRPLDALAPQDLGPMPVTSGQPFWSPDARTIGFTALATIRTVPAAGGPVFVVCTIPVSGRIMSARWLTSGNIVFSVWRDSLYTVPSAGGTPVLHTAINPATEIDFHDISVVSGDRLIVSTHQRRDETEVVELIDGSRRVVLSRDRTAGSFQYVPQGFLLFSRSAVNVGVWAVPFSGGPIDTTKATLIQSGATGFQAAGEGTLLVSMTTPSRAVLVWVDRGGSASPIAGPPIEQARPDLALSPDGRRVALIAGAGADSNLVIRDLQTGLDTRLTFNRAAESGAGTFELRSPAWFPAGDRILHMMGSVEADKLVSRRADVAGDGREIRPGTRGVVSPDGRSLVFLLDDRGRSRLRQAPLLSDGSVGSARPVLADGTEPNVVDAALSPDGHLLAYAARQPDNSLNVFLTSFPGASAQWLVGERASRPRFSRNGRELFYITGLVDERTQQRKGVLMSAKVTADPIVTIGAAVPLFDDVATDAPSLGSYDVAPDGRFLMSKPIAAAAGDGPRLVLVQNWLAAMKETRR